MDILKDVSKILTTWIFIVLLLICIIMIPRDIDYSGGEKYSVVQKYDFSWELYTEKVSSFFLGVWENQSLGESRYGNSVEEEIMRYVPRSLWLIISAFIICIPLGILKGIYDYKKTNSRYNVLGNGTTWLFQSLPDFFIVMVIQFLLLKLMQGSLIHFSVYGYEKWYNFILPSILLSVYPTMYIARITSSSLSGQEKQAYIQTARAKGLTGSFILYKHMLANCWSVILSHISSIMVYILSNLLIIEYLMYYKGAAYRLFEAFGHHNSATNNFYRVGHKETYESELIIGLLLSFMLVILVSQIISTITKNVLDPRRGDE
jgi:oligopeptide transport system permease protein